MKRFYIIALCFFLSSISVWAQSSLSDDEIIEYVVAQNKQGVSRQQIAAQLLERGVTKEQLQRVQKKYQSQNSNISFGDVDIDSTPKLRVPNGDKRDASLDIDNQENNTANDANALPSVQRNKRVIFGHNVFNNKYLTFESSMNLATPQNYKLGPGDAVNIEIWGSSQTSITEYISPDGTITVNGIGVIELSGLTIEKAKAKLRRELGARFEDSEIDVTLGQTRSITVSVMGEVKMPGTYTISAFSTVYNALYMAGGPNDIGTMRNVKVYRNGKLVTNVDIYDFLLNGKLSGDVRLQDNDIITVSPYEALVCITGKVKRPMYYEMKKGETAATLIQYAGGFTGDAYTKAIRVNRRTEPQLSVFSIGEFDLSQFKLMDEDSINIDATLNRYQNMVEVRGAVFRPGMYQISGTINTVKALVEAAAGLTEGAIAQHAIMHRLKEDRTLKVISVNVKGILDGTVADIPLQNEDILYVGSTEVREKQKTVSIFGEVYAPGTYQYADDESIEDLIIQAGGPTEAASHVKIDVARRISDPNATNSSDSITKIFSFKLNPDFTIEGNTKFALEPFDQIYVRRSPNYNVQQNVIVEGEVEFEGTYALTNKTQRLSEVIKRAGGTTKYAYLKGAKLLRQMTQEERMVAESVLRTAQRNSGSDSIDINKLMLQANYPIGFELDQALKNPGTDEDPILREGDRIIIPRLTSSVSVNGEVIYPNTVRYKDGKSSRYYIKQAGGYSSNAKKSKTIIIYMNGMVAKANRKNKPMPGCQIVVPTKRKGHRTSLAEILTIGTTSASIGTMLAAIASMTK
jgi:protein involved in polysaccharide export with SLBB domain